jgi:hypothetical protein
LDGYLKGGGRVTMGFTIVKGSRQDEARRAAGAEMSVL